MGRGSGGCVCEGGGGGDVVSAVLCSRLLYGISELKQGKFRYVLFTTLWTNSEDNKFLIVFFFFFFRKQDLTFHAHWRQFA